MIKVLSRLMESRTSFRQRLLTVVTLGILGMALTASLATAWVTSSQARSQMIAQGLQITDSLAGQSILALLYDSPENGEEPLQAILSFPSVDEAGIYDPQGRPLLIRGKGSVQSRGRFPAESISEQPALTETGLYLYFLAPVFTGGPSDQDQSESPFQLDPVEHERIGYVSVLMDKSSLRALQFDIFFNNIAIGLSFALVLVFLLNFGIKRLTRPLYQLSDLMQEAERLGPVYASLTGPKEITRMADTFNRMMASIEERDRRLRQHQATLQSEVAIRTRELVQARDAALTASRHKSEFLANMTHELRTPLQAIIGYADVVREELEVEGMDENAGEMERVIHNAQRLLGLINNILDLAKVEAGRMELRLQTVNLQELAREAADTILPLVKQNENRLETKIDPAAEPCLLDREKVLQAILNLLSNAAKFTSKGLVTLIIERSDRLLTIKVADTGIGLDRAQQSIIFEEFRQADGSATRKFEGTGLGLAITRRFCELMGGDIEVQSTPGVGSVFTIRVPLQTDAEGDGREQGGSEEGVPAALPWPISAAQRAEV